MKHRLYDLNVVVSTLDLDLDVGSRDVLFSGINTCSPYSTCPGSNIKWTGRHLVIESGFNVGVSAVWRPWNVFRYFTKVQIIFHFIWDHLGPLW